MPEHFTDAFLQKRGFWHLAHVFRFTLAVAGSFFILAAYFHFRCHRQQLRRGEVSWTEHQLGWTCVCFFGLTAFLDLCLLFKLFKPVSVFLDLCLLSDFLDLSLLFKLFKPESAFQTFLVSNSFSNVASYWIETFCFWQSGVRYAISIFCQYQFVKNPNFIRKLWDYLEDANSAVFRIVLNICNNGFTCFIWMYQ